MPRLLLSTENRSRNSARSAEPHGDLGPLRRQVFAITDAILSGTAPEEAAVREQLRWHLADNPDQPEKALLNHLLSVSTSLQDDSA
ncbi:hypothetical protein [Arthrobacter sp. B3I4]|uniref:hypothetical protein n=1 Tax=Arthrobacter sp. B3I4 TaxID=3042267 RepID=UPI00278A55E7|nr:hypothetical protein [Arthrobacter sp. B3I4]MDQ0754040.1 hypothetical protein [Arthrobacter sp. B3I4]